MFLIATCLFGSQILHIVFRELMYFFIKLNIECNVYAKFALTKFVTLIIDIYINHLGITKVFVR